MIQIYSLHAIKIEDRFITIDELRNYRKNGLLAKLFMMGADIKKRNDHYVIEATRYTKERVGETQYINNLTNNQRIELRKYQITWSIFIDRKIHDRFIGGWGRCIFIDCDMKNVGIFNTPRNTELCFYDTKCHNVVHGEGVVSVNGFHNGYFEGCKFTYDNAAQKLREECAERE